MDGKLVRAEDCNVQLTTSQIDPALPTVGGGCLADVQLLSDLEQKDTTGDHSSGLSTVKADFCAPELDPMGTTVDDLPNELMLEIFSYMSIRENVDVLQKVCTRWKILAQDAQLWYDKEYEIGKKITFIDLHRFKEDGNNFISKQATGIVYGRQVIVKVYVTITHMLAPHSLSKRMENKFMVDKK